MGPSNYSCRVGLGEQDRKAGRKDETSRGWMKDRKRVTSMEEVKHWRPGTKALWEIRLLSEECGSVDTYASFLSADLGDKSKHKIRY